MLHGPLHEISLIEVLQLLERGGRSGHLRVVGSDSGIPRTITLSRGRIVDLVPDADDANVSLALIRRHLAVAEDDAVYGPAGVPDSVRHATREQLATRALSQMFQWTRGRFDLAEAADPSGPLDWSPDAVVIAFVRREALRFDLAQTLEDFHAVPDFVPPDAGSSHPGYLRLEADDWRVLDAVDGVRDVAAIADLLGEAVEEVGERVGQLTSAAILELHPAIREMAIEARLAIEAGRHDEAISQLQQRLATRPDDGEAWRLLGLAEVGAGRFDRAIAAWQAWAGADAQRADEASALLGAAHTMMEALRETRD